MANKSAIPAYSSSLLHALQFAATSTPNSGARAAMCPICPT